MQFQQNFFGERIPIPLTDTAGIRKKGKVFETIEKFSIIKTLNAVEQSNIVALLIDGKDGLSAQDLAYPCFCDRNRKVFGCRY